VGSFLWRFGLDLHFQKLHDTPNNTFFFMAGIFRNLFNQFTKNLSMKDPLVMSAAVCYGLNTVGFAITAATHTHKLIDITGEHLMHIVPCISNQPATERQ
jgi:hypothetical protein